MIAILLVLGLIVVNWAIKEKDKELDFPAILMHKEAGVLMWVELEKANKAQVTGRFNQWIQVEDEGKESHIDVRPSMINANYKKNEYKWNVMDDGEKHTYHGWVSDGKFLVQPEGETEPTTLHPVDEATLQAEQTALEQAVESTDEDAEYKEKNRLKHFFEKLNNVYGFVYASEDNHLQLFIKIDEALLEGEVSGLLTVTEWDADEQTYQEKVYEANGITDGRMLEWFVEKEEESVKLEGSIQEEARWLELSYWNADQPLDYIAVTKDEYELRHKEFLDKKAD